MVMDAHAEHPDPESGALEVHVVPPKVLLSVWGGLLFLTVVTVAVTEVDLGSLALPVALVIAATKATVVALFFMHLRWDRPFLGVVFLIAISFVMLFIITVLVDTQIYQPERIPGYAPGLGR
jgi:cytochrome c oxidase subunit 4